MGAGTTILVAALLSVAAPSPAAAQRCSGDDVAALHQYCEQLPGAKGPTGVEGVTATLRKSLPARVRRRLQNFGPEGTALLALPVGVAPASAGPRGPRRDASGAVSGTLIRRGDRGVVVRAVGTIAGSGLSGGFRWALALSALLVAGTAWVRRRA